MQKRRLSVFSNTITERKGEFALNSSIQLFNNNDFYVRSFNDNGEIWFVAKDIAQALEYSEAGSITTLFGKVPEIWKGSKPIATPGGVQEMLCLTEQGLYFFLGRSDKENALPYQMWIAGDVVPSIRKTGSYNLPQSKGELPSGVLDGARFIFETAGIKDNQLTLALDKVYKSYTGRSALLAGEIQLEAPVKEQALTPSEIAETIGFCSGKKGAKSVNNLLKIFGFQRKIVGNWEPIGRGLEYAVVLDTNKKHSDGTPIRQIKWNSSIIPVLEELLPF